MEHKQSPLPPASSGLLGKLLLPGYTDAGASTSFVPSASANNLSDADAKTEIRDNRSSQLMKSDLIGKKTPRNSAMPQASPKRQQEQENSPAFGFFPSTKRTIKQSPPSVSPASSQQPQDPPSPPVVTRQTMPLTSTTSMEEELAQPFAGERDGDEEDLQAAESASEVVTTVTSASSSVLGTKFLQETREERDLLHRQLMQRDGGIMANFKQETPGTEVGQVVLNSGSPTNLSEVLSTASEMGTVINVTHSKERLEEVEAMAALIETSPAYQGRDTSLHHTLVRAQQAKAPTIETLALPALESQGNDMVTSDAVQKPRIKYKTDLSSTQMDRFQPDTESIPDLKTMEGGGPSALLSATIRRIGSGLSKTPRTSHSAPNTPLNPIQYQPSRVQELLKSTLSPKRDYRNNPPRSFALRSPGSAAHHFLQRSASKKRSRHVDESILSRSGTTHYESTPANNLDASNTATPGLATALHLSSKCFSFDSTLDAEYRYDCPDDDEHLSAHAHDGRVKLAKHMSWDQLQDTSGTSSSTNSRHLHHSSSWDGPVRLPLRPRSALTFRPKTHYYEADLSTQNDKWLVQRARMDSDYSPQKANTVHLQTPQRVELEREDALDILMCLVQQGLTWEVASNDDSAEDFEEEIRRDLCSDVIDSSDMKLAFFKDLVAARSYAIEMKRAAKSASAWLDSVRKSDVEAFDAEEEGITTPAEELLTSSGGQASGEANASEVSASSSLGADKMEILTLRSRLKSLQLEMKEKTAQTDRLNAELSKCRGEIGRLRTVSRNASLTLTPNRSILDDDPEDSADSDLATSQQAMGQARSPSPILRSMDDSNADIDVQSDLFGQELAAAKLAERDAAVAAVLEANETIRRLHRELQEARGDSSEKLAPPVIEVPIRSETISKASKEADQSVDDGNRTVNVRMLDGENFVTEWSELIPPLPPPPDHDLRSPIVNAVLNQWTRDEGLHESLLSWIERVASGESLDNIPPLTISSLDHQVRDGFSMHVLPMLLRRADIHVNVQSRAHRKTTYDLAVTVARKTRMPPPFTPDQQERSSIDDWKSPFDADQKSTTHSAVTARISNASSSPVYSKSSLPSGEAAIGQLTESRTILTSTSHEDFSDDLAAENNPSIMSTLGGALGGLLSRRKPTLDEPPEYEEFPIPARSPAAKPQKQGNVVLEEQPYHRVVSAPPGRIGITFVEYRGHAMVSDVAPDSPLSGWVFPSDVLIAIDEIPVSGMRVRDIVKILTNRRDRQRALRVISSHAMNEFALNQSMLNDGPTP